MYNGIVPGLQRQMAFSAIRIGGYETVKQKYTEMTGANTTFSILGVRIAAGITTGTLAILAAQPTDVCILIYLHNVIIVTMLTFYF